MPNMDYRFCEENGETCKFPGKYCGKCKVFKDWCKQSNDFSCSNFERMVTCDHRCLEGEPCQYEGSVTK
jgi:hypothetical protein